MNEWRARGGALSVMLLLFAGCPRRSAETPPVPLAFQPQSAAFEVPFGGEVTEDFRLVGQPPASMARIALAVEGPADPDLRVEPLPAGPALGPGLRIHASGRRVGTRVGTLQVLAHRDGAARIPLLYALRVRGTLTVVPTNPLVDLRAADPAAVIDVHSAQPGFAVTSAEIATGPFAAAVTRGDGGAYQVRVTIVPARFPPGARGAAGTLVIHSTDRVEPRKEVPLFAFGHAP